MEINPDGPVFVSKSVYKNNKRYNFDESVTVFDCPYCEYLITTATIEGAETAMDMHYFHHHPEVHVPLISVPDKAKIAQAFHELRIRSNSPVGRLRQSRN